MPSNTSGPTSGANSTAKSKGKPYDLVRVRGPKAEFTATRVSVEGVKGHTVLEDKPAVDDFGRGLAPKPITDKAGNPAPTQEA